MSTNRKILIIRPRFLGDLILTTGLGEIFHNEWPGCEVWTLTESRYAPILQHHPFIQGTEGFESKRKNNPFYLASFFRDLRRLKPDVVLDLFGNPRTAQMTYWSGASTRVGFRLRGRSWAYNRIAPPSSPRLPSGNRRAIEAFLDQARELGLKAEGPYRTKLVVSAEERDYVAKLFERASIKKGDPVALLNPGASWPAKHWPLERFMEVGARLKAEGFRLIFHFGPGEEKLIAAFQERMDKDWILINQPSLRGLMAFIEASQVLVSNDTGTMHMGPALGTPTIGLFGPQGPDTWFAYEKPHQAMEGGVPCAYCGLTACPLMSCLKNITPLEVARAALAAARMAPQKP